MADLVPGRVGRPVLDCKNCLNCLATLLEKVAVPEELAEAKA
jgi:hypothetical protein